MKPALVNSTGQHARIGSSDKFMTVGKLSIPNGPSRYVPVTEVELSASHTFDSSHLDPSCPDCSRLRAQLTFIAQSALEHVSEMRTEIDFKIYTDPGIVCSPGDSRPSVTASIYVWDRPEALPANSPAIGASAAISQIQRALAAAGLLPR
jgi:hypothetical protein